MTYFKYIVIILLISFSTPVFAQSSKPEIQVKITNQLNETISDAEVTLTNLKQNNRQIRLKSKDIFRFTDLINGIYQISVKAAGFKNYQTDIFSIQNEVKIINLILEIAPIETKVEVGSGNEADTDRFGTTRILSESELEKLPNDPKLLEKVLREIAGETVTGEEMPITVNGFKGKVPPKQAIQQVRINQNIFSAQYADSIGGGIEIFTKTEVDKLSGNIGFDFADSRVNAKDAFLGKRIPSQTKAYSLYLFGPAFNKKIAYSLSLTQNDTNNNTVVNAVTLNTQLQPIEYKQFFPSRNNNDEIQLSMFYDPSEKHKIYFGYEFIRQQTKGKGIDELSLPSRTYNSKEQNNTLQFSYTFLANENVVNEFRLHWNKVNSKNFGESNEVAVNVLDSFSGGGAQIANNTANTKLEITNNTSWQRGNYELRFGVQINRQKINQTSESNFGGTYVFTGKTAPQLDENNNPVYDGSGNLLTSEITSLESYRRTLLFQRLGFSVQQIRLLGGGASQFTISGGNPKLSVNQFDIGIYLQNSYKISKSLALSFGLRYENQTNIKSNYNFAPRIGLVWLPKTDKNKVKLFSLPKISLGFGIFYTRFEPDKTVEIKEANDSDKRQYLITAESILNLFPSIPTINLLNQFALPKTQRRLSFKFQTPFQMLYSINISKKLPFNFSVNTTITYTKGMRQEVTRNANESLYEINSIGNRENSRFSTTINLPPTKRFGAFLTYTQILIANDDITAGSGSSFNPFDFSNEFGKSGLPRKQLAFYPTFRLPYGVEIFASFSIKSGSRFNITTGRDANGDGFFFERPAFAKNLTKQGLIITKYGILDPNPEVNDKIIPRNLGQGRLSVRSDAFLSKSFGIGEKDQENNFRHNIAVSISINNLLNVVNKANPIGNMSSPNFLRSVSGINSDIKTFINGSQVNNSLGRSFFFSLNYGF